MPCRTSLSSNKEDIERVLVPAEILFLFLGPRLEFLTESSTARRTGSLQVFCSRLMSASLPGMCSFFFISRISRSGIVSLRTSSCCLAKYMPSSVKATLIGFHSDLEVRRKRVSSNKAVPCFGMRPTNISALICVTLCFKSSPGAVKSTWFSFAIIFRSMHLVLFGLFFTGRPSSLNLILQLHLQLCTSGTLQTDQWPL